SHDPHSFPTRRSSDLEISENCLRTEISFGAVAVGKDFAATVHQNETRKATHEIVLNRGFAPELLVVHRRPRHVGLSHISFHPERSEEHTSELQSRGHL